ncbi:chorismate-binding protein [Cupriavidus necator]|uniref:chorismate-binding protein n=1 Tax=Cupriavidus necator TaxID=106590 RepID=UPI00068FECBA|nr:chorismate-binding protein [Cupriavidus necator]
MIVGLMRYDMGKIARVGSVTVSDLFELECYLSIWTMNSTVRADVGQASLLELLRALFPCGSVTGATRIAFMRNIVRWRAGIAACIAGASAAWRPAAIFPRTVAIRTLVIKGSGHGVYGVGAALAPTPMRSSSGSNANGSPGFCGPAMRPCGPETGGPLRLEMPAPIHRAGAG